MAIKEIGAALDRVARNTINDNFKSQDGRIDNLVLQAGDAHPELQDAHYSGVKGQTFATVGKRFDAVEQQAITDKATANSELQAGLATKRDKSVMLTQADMSTASEAHKLTMNHLSQEVKNAMTGTTPVSPNIEDGQITNEKLANSAITNDKIANGTIFGNKISNFTENLGPELIALGSEIYGTYAHTNGDIVAGPADVCRTEYIPVIENEYYIMYTYTTTVLSATGVIYDASKKFIRNLEGFEISGDKLLVKMPVGAAFIIINNGRTTASKYTLKKVVKKSLPWLEMPAVEIPEKNTALTHCLDKPFNFSGKSAVWFGDSITVGVTSPNLVVSANGYAKQVSQKIGVSYANQAYSGSTIADSSKTAVSSENNIVNKIINYTTAKDFIFIAGGTNDWTLGVPVGKLGDSTKATFYGALKVICDSIKTNNPSAKVIFITPINQNVGRPNSVDTLDKYRQAIFEVAVKNGHSVVDGSQIGFSKTQDAFTALMCADGVHPSQLGHDFYAKSLVGILV